MSNLWEALFGQGMLGTSSQWNAQVVAKAQRAGNREDNPYGAGKTIKKPDYFTIEVEHAGRTIEGEKLPDVPQLK